MQCRSWAMDGRCSCYLLLFSEGKQVNAWRTPLPFMFCCAGHPTVKVSLLICFKVGSFLLPIPSDYCEHLTVLQRNYAPRESMLRFPSWPLSSLLLSRCCAQTEPKQIQGEGHRQWMSGTVWPSRASVYGLPQRLTIA